MGTGGFFPWGRGVMLTTHPLLVPRLRNSRSYTSCHPDAPLWCVTGPLYLFYLFIDWNTQLKHQMSAHLVWTGRTSYCLHILITVCVRQKALSVQICPWTLEWHPWNSAIAASNNCTCARFGTPALRVVRTASYKGLKDHRKTGTDECSASWGWMCYRRWTK
jgi:hypothetical protein